jgi:hypothetical protein
MSWFVVKLLLVVVVAHGARAAGALAGPRWGGLLLGLPTSTGIVLFCLAREQGLSFAMQATGPSVLGQAVAVVFATGFALGAGRGWRLPALLLAAVTGYLLAAGAFWWVGPPELSVALPVSALIIALGCLADRRGPAAVGRPARPALPWPASLGLRTVLPVACVLAVTHLAEHLGPQGAGLLSAFPSTLLAVLAVTYLEDGRAAAAQTARAFPQGQFSTLAFLLVFWLAGPSAGLGGAIGLGSAAALLTLLATEGLLRRRLRQLPGHAWGRGGGPPNVRRRGRPGPRRSECRVCRCTFGWPAGAPPRAAGRL